LFDVRNLVEAIQMAAENLEDDQREVIQTAGGAVLDPPATEKEMAQARAYIEKSGGYLRQRGGQEQAKPIATAT
jgi:hypothetical protein